MKKDRLEQAMFTAFPSSGEINATIDVIKTYVKDFSPNEIAMFGVYRYQQFDTHTAIRMVRALREVNEDG